MYSLKNISSLQILISITLLLLWVIWYSIYLIYQASSSKQVSYSFISDPVIDDTAQDSSWVQDQNAEHTDIIDDDTQEDEVTLSPEELARQERLAQQKLEEERVKKEKLIQEIQEDIRNFERIYIALRESELPENISTYQCASVNFNSWDESRNMFLWPYSLQSRKILQTLVDQINGKIRYNSFWIDIPGIDIQFFWHIPYIRDLRYRPYRYLPDNYRDLGNEYIYLSDTGKCERVSAHQYIQSIDELPKDIPFRVTLNIDSTIRLESWKHPTYPTYTLTDFTTHGSYPGSVISEYKRDENISYYLEYNTAPSVKIDNHRYLFHLRHCWDCRRIDSYIALIDLKDKKITYTHVWPQSVRDHHHVYSAWFAKHQYLGGNIYVIYELPIKYDGIYDPVNRNVLLMSIDAQTTKVDTLISKEHLDWGMLVDFLIADDRLFILVLDDKNGSYIAEIDANTWEFLHITRPDNLDMSDTIRDYDDPDFGYNYRLVYIDTTNNSFILSYRPYYWDDTWAFIKIQDNEIIDNILYFGVFGGDKYNDDYIIWDYVNFLHQHELLSGMTTKVPYLEYSWYSEGSYFYLEFIRE